GVVAVDHHRPQRHRLGERPPDRTLVVAGLFRECVRIESIGAPGHRWSPFTWSKSLRASAPLVTAAPARRAAAIRAVSATSARVAPAVRALRALASRQYGHCVVQATASALSSRYLRGIVPSPRLTTLSSATKPAKSAGASVLISPRNL